MVWSAYQLMAEDVAVWCGESRLQICICGQGSRREGEAVRFNQIVFGLVVMKKRKVCGRRERQSFFFYFQIDH